MAKQRSKDIQYRIWERLNNLNVIVEEEISEKPRREVMARLLRQVLLDTEELQKIAAEEVWDFIENVTECPLFDGINRDPTETFLRHMGIKAGDSDDNCIRTETVREALEEFAKKLGIEVPYYARAIRKDEIGSSNK